jgi:hypothetical protein
MTCVCLRQPPVVKINGDPSQLYPNFQLIARGDWRLLFRCPTCSQLWVMDEWDKFVVQFAIKVDSMENWDSVHEDKLKPFLQQSKGGLGDAKCLWAGCNNLQLRNSAYCVDHLFALGVRV